jgi:Na+/pantothenate symporter
MLLTFLGTGCITGSLYFPAVAALYAQQVSARGVVYSIVVALAVSIPFSIFANTQGDEPLIELSSLSSIVPGLILLLMTRLRQSSGN